MGKVLEATGLTKRYPGFVLEDATFSVEEGSIAGFIGRNGAGKTTALKSLLNLVHPDKGSIRFFGLDLKEHEAHIKQRIGFASGGLSYYPKSRLGDIVAVTSSFYDTWDDGAWEHYRSVFRLSPDKTPQELSAGMRVKFNIALALSHNAEMLVLDEPTSGLDPVSRAEIIDIFLQLKRKGVGILFSTHITSDLEECADSIIYIKEGRIRECCSKEGFMERYAHLGDTLQDVMVALERDEVVL